MSDEKKGVSYDDFMNRSRGVSYQDFENARARYSRNTYGNGDGQGSSSQQRNPNRSGSTRSQHVDENRSQPSRGNIERGYADDGYDQTQNETSQSRSRGRIEQSEAGERPRGRIEQGENESRPRGRAERDGGGRPERGGSSRPSGRPNGERPGRSGSANDRGGRGGSGGGGSSPKNKKKGHPVLKIFGAILILIILFFAGTFVYKTFIKSADAWQREYTGTWQVQAVGNAAHPIMSLGGSIVLGNATDMGSHMILGITGNESQITNFGMHKEYAFSFDKGHCVMTAADGSKLEGDLVLGHLVVRDNSGTITLYEKKTDMYVMNTNPSQPDTQALIGIVEKAAAGAGDAGQQALQMLQGVDQGQLEQYLNQADPEQVQKMIGQLDPAAISEFLKNGGDASQVLSDIDPQFAQVIAQQPQDQPRQDQKQEALAPAA